MLKPPSSEHILGTDKIGRDVFARIIYGGRISILVGLGSALGAALIGVSIGAYTAYRGGWWDSIFLRISEIFMAFPQIILVLFWYLFWAKSNESDYHFYINWLGRALQND